jgi:hypothetical protein
VVCVCVVGSKQELEAVFSYVMQRLVSTHMGDWRH